MNNDWLMNTTDGSHNETPTVDEQWDNALFLMRVTQEHSLTHEGVESFCVTAQSFAETICEYIQKEIETVLSRRVEENVDDCLREELIDQCKVGDLFEGLTSRHSKEQYYKDHFNYTVSYQDSFTCSMYVF